MEKKSKHNKFKVAGVVFLVLILFGACSSLFGEEEEEKSLEDLEADNEQMKEEMGMNEEESTEERSEEKTEEQTEEVTEEETTEEPTEEETTEEPTGEATEESEPEEEPDEELTPEDEIKNVVTESLGEDKVSEINVNEYDGSFEVDVTFAASENFSAGMTANGIKRDIVDTTLDLKEMDHYISYLLITATLPLTDSSGNESDGQVMSASFSGETIDDLNADNEVFLYDNLENAADGFSAHPEFRE